MNFDSRTFECAIALRLIVQKRSSSVDVITGILGGNLGAICGWVTQRRPLMPKLKCFSRLYTFEPDRVVCRLAVMTPASHGIESEIGSARTETFCRNLLSGLRANTETCLSMKPKLRSNLARSFRKKPKHFLSHCFTDLDYIVKNDAVLLVSYTETSR